MDMDFSRDTLHRFILQLSREVSAQNFTLFTTAVVRNCPWISKQLEHYSMAFYQFSQKEKQNFRTTASLHRLLMTVFVFPLS